MLTSRTRAPQPAAVVFDMDGVLTPTMPLHERSWVEAFARFGIAFDPAEVYRREGEKSEQFIAHILRLTGKRLARAERDALYDDKRAIFARLVRRPRLVPGAAALLRRLRAASIPTALVSGSSDRSVKRAVPAATLRGFDSVVTADRVRRGKPHPDPFRLAVKEIGVRAEDAIAVENAPLGIAAAKAAGLRCYAITSTLPARALRGADRVMRDLREVEEWLLPSRPARFRRG